MPKLLHLSPALTGVPLDAATETFGIFGQKGSGKSTTAARFVEQLVGAGGRAVIADPTGVWYGLMHDGTGPGLAGIVLGGEHGDMLLDPSKGNVVAEFVVAQDTYPIVVLDLKLMRKADRTRFMLAFMETLYHENREALHLVLDEAHQFAPTQAREGGDQIKLLGAVEDVVALGRSRGLGITMISQRFATLNANVREQIGTLIVHRLVGSLDRKALRGWIEANGDPSREKEVLETMAKLGTGRALVWSPAFLDYFGVEAIERPVTFDSRATPKVGQRVKRPGKRAVVNLDTLRARMAETIAEVDSKDPVKLRARITELTREVEDSRRRAMVEPAVEVVTEVVRFAVVEPEDLAAIAAAREAIERVEARLRDLPHDYAEQVTRQKVATAPTPARAPARSPERPVAPSPAVPVIVVQPSSHTGHSAQSDASIRAGARRMVEVLARHHPLRYTKAQWATLAGMKHTGGTWGAYMSAVLRAGYVDRQGDLYGATESGLAFSGVTGGAPMSPEEVREVWRGKLRAGARAMFDQLVEVYPSALDKVSLADRVGMAVTGGTFGAYLGTLKRNGLAEVVADGAGIRATDVAMGAAGG